MKLRAALRDGFAPGDLGGCEGVGNGGRGIVDGRAEGEEDTSTVGSGEGSGEDDGGGGEGPAQGVSGLWERGLGIVGDGDNGGAGARGESVELAEDGEGPCGAAGGEVFGPGRR